MALMKILGVYLFALLALMGCTQVGYLTEQGLGQARLQWRGRDNKQVLKDPKISDSHKQKILLIQSYKKFFYDYFQAKESSIYNKTTILEDEAVTYLVVASPRTEIKAHEFEFPLMGSFPYIGFFRLNSAKDFARKLEQDQKLITWIRPVYAYSTLGYLEDRILSSFFKYDELELAELIFHELFHTIFFIKNEVELNENLANFYSRELLKEYFRDRPELAEYFKIQEKRTKVDQRVVELISILQQEFSKLGAMLSPQKADELTQRFVSEVLKPQLSSLCLDLELLEKDCELSENWNQASFAAFLTYEKQQNFLEDLHRSVGMDLRGFLQWLKTEYVSYDNQRRDNLFADYLKQKVTYAPSASY
jgi:predicted aminopeptidase